MTVHQPRHGLRNMTGDNRVIWVGRFLIVVISVALVALLGRVAQLQLSPPGPIAKKIGSQISRYTMTGRRGSLLDRHGRPIATSSPTTRLFIDPQRIDDPGTFAEHVGYQLGYDPAGISRLLSTRMNRRYVVLDHELTDDRLRQVEAMKLPAIGTQHWLKRIYPNDQLASQLIGVVGRDGRGLEGLELRFNSQLTAASGRMAYLRDVQRRVLWINADDYTPPVDGRNVRLSIDLTIQAIVEQQLKATCQKFDAAHGQIIVIAPQSGEILALANYPTFDPNDLARSTPDQRRNRAATHMFEPGSTFKPFIWAAATQAGLASPNDIIDCTQSGLWVSEKGRRLRDSHNHGHGRITWSQVLALSSNIGMAQIGQRMGIRRMYQTVRAFGFGTTTGSGLPGEAVGIINPVKKWNHYSITSVPMGHELAVTGLQLVRAFCAIANQGDMPTLSIEPVAPDQLIIHRVISPAAAALTLKALRLAVTDGTGKPANSSRYDVFGKTGTAQVPDPQHGGYLADKYVASFIGGAPVSQPRIVVGCFIHQPDKTKGYYGSKVCAPAVREIIEQTLLYMGVTPNRTGSPRNLPATQLVQVNH